MGKYSALDKITSEDLEGSKLVNSYRGCKIYLDDDGYSIVSRGYLVDACLTTVELAKKTVDQFRSNL